MSRRPTRPSPRAPKTTRREARCFVPLLEALEGRLLPATSFLQGYAFVDNNGNQVLDAGDVPLAGATIQLRSADGSTLLRSTTTNADGYYRFDGVAAGDYRLVEVPPAGFATGGVQLQSVFDPASANGQAIQVTVKDPTTLTDVTVNRQPGLPGVTAGYTVTGGPFNSETQSSGTAHQFQVILTGSDVVGSPLTIYTFCTDLFHGNPATFPVSPSLTPEPPALSANIGRIGYLYNHFGQALLSPTDGGGLQLAIWELEYDSTPDLSAGNFVVTPPGPGSPTDAGAYAAALNYLSLSAGKDERAFFLNVNADPGTFGLQGMIATEGFNFANFQLVTPAIHTTPGPAITVGSGAKLTDTALLSGGNNPTGTITFYLFAPGVTPNANNSNAVDTEMVPVNGNGTYTTPAGYLPQTAGTYQWVAAYSGDGHNASVASPFGEEPETVARATPAIHTVPGPTLVLGSGAPLSDTAVLSNGFNPTGTITFTLLGPDGVTVVYTDHVPVSGNGTYGTNQGDNPGGYLPLTTGTYQWLASYGGDANNVSVASPRGDEPETVIMTGGGGGGRSPETQVFPLPFPQAATSISKLNLLSSNVLAWGGNLNAPAVFVGGLYRNLLGRDASQDELDGWVFQLLTGTPRQGVVDAIWRSPEHYGVEVDHYYATFLHRAADPGGRAAWVNALLGGAGEEGVLLGFLTSPEYAAAHPNNAGFVTGLYLDVLGRFPDAAGLAGWMQAMQGGASRAAVAWAFLGSAEAYTGLVETYYVSFLHRPASPEEVSSWVAQLQGGLQTIASAGEAFLASDEYLLQAIQASAF